MMVEMRGNSTIYMKDGQANKKGSVLDWTTETLHCMQKTLYSAMPIDFPQYAYENMEVGGRRQGSERFTSQPFSLKIITFSFLYFVNK